MANPHGLMVATIPVAKASARVRRSRPLRHLDPEEGADLLAQLLLAELRVWTSRMVPSAAMKAVDGRPTPPTPLMSSPLGSSPRS